MWFTANLLFQSVHPDHPENESLWEERLVLVRAETEDDALREAERLGKAEEHQYVAATGDLVCWTFRQVESVSPVEALEHGTELFSRFLGTREVESLLSPLRE